MSEETIRPQKHGRAKKPARVSRRVAVFGTVILIFAIIGVIATVIAATRFTIDLVENKSQKEELRRHVFPLVILDPPAFDSIDKLDPQTILEAGIWDFIMFEDKAKYDKDDLGNMSVPATDIETHIIKVFGQSAVIQHQEISDSELQILYDEESKTYSIPAAANMMTYVPDIEKVERQGDLYTVTVGYVPSGPIWEGDINGNKYQPEPDKSLKYVLKKTGKDSYIITAVQEIPSGHPGDTGSDSSYEDYSEPAVSDGAASGGDAVSSPAEGTESGAASAPAGTSSAAPASSGASSTASAAQ